MRRRILAIVGGVAAIVLLACSTTSEEVAALEEAHSAEVTELDAECEAAIENIKQTVLSVSLRDRRIEQKRSECDSSRLWLEEKQLQEIRQAEEAAALAQEKAELDGFIRKCIEEDGGIQRLNDSLERWGDSFRAESIDSLEFSRTELYEEGRKGGVGRISGIPTVNDGRELWLYLDVYATELVSDFDEELRAGDCIAQYKPTYTARQ